MSLFSACTHTCIYMNATYWVLQLPVLQVLYVFGVGGGSGAGHSIYTQACTHIYSVIYVCVHSTHAQLIGIRTC